MKETKSIRDSEWKASLSPDALIDRRVEITGPVDRKMIINGLNSGANVFMADFEDSCSPTWKNIISGQKNLIDAISGTISLAANSVNDTHIDFGTGANLSEAAVTKPNVPSDPISKLLTS